MNRFLATVPMIYGLEVVFSGDLVTSRIKDHESSKPIKHRFAQDNILQCRGS